ncbi:MFS transporter [Streptomyces dioscori]|uniref:MFS transporter n=1 Tax=Streptomyces dioscori TaxID=2109333 RepID=A0A2P8Q9K3_9ACTN|nr:MFS transporter [Streptomyces dioscori]PSM42926.1 MFS transporter [Streptomyces dioscori]
MSSLHTSPSPDRRWLILVVVSTAQLIVVINAVVLNVALPSAQADLHISDSARQWVLTSYTLVFGGLLLLGGRLGDLFGRKRVFLIGLIGFSLASALGGVAPTTWVLLVARALQGVFGALLAPAVLSLISLTFPEGKDRARAFGVFAAITTSGSALGLLLGGVLTDYLNWRWALLISIPLALVPIVGALLYIHDDTVTDRTAHLDVPGAVLATAGLAVLVYGFPLAQDRGWTDAGTLSAFAVGVLLITAFAFLQTRRRDPLLPLRILTERNRLGAYTSAGLGLLSLYGVSLFLTFYLQTVKGYSPALTGVGFLPLVVAQALGAAGLGAWLMARIRPRTIMAGGYLGAGVSVLLLVLLDADTPYTPVLLIAQIGIGLGLGAALMPATSLASYNVRSEDAGVASAMINISQQVGGSIGTALLNTIASTATAGYLVAHHTAARQTALVHGYHTAYIWAAGSLFAAALVSFLLVNLPRPRGVSTLAPVTTKEKAV